MTRSIIALKYGNETAARNVLKTRGNYVNEDDSWNAAYVDAGIPIVDENGELISGFHLNILVNDGDTTGLDNLPAFKARLRESKSVALKWQRDLGTDEPSLQRVFA